MILSCFILLQLKQGWCDNLMDFETKFISKFSAKFFDKLGTGE